MPIPRKNEIRTEIARKVRALREERRWTQMELSNKLGLSQGRYSEVERGRGSFTAEQLLEILKLFNVPVSHFAGERAGPGPGLQNALARLGAAHLPERQDVLPSERLEAAGDVVREALLGAESPRQISSLAPVLVHNIDQINLNRLRAQFLEYGLERRLAWLIENTLVAVQHTLAEAPQDHGDASYRRAELILGAYIDNVQPDRLRPRTDEPLDVLDAQIISEESLQEAQASASAASRRWGIATILQPADFVEALKASHSAARNPSGKPRSRPKPVKAPKDAVPEPLPARPMDPGPQPLKNEGPRGPNPIQMDWD